jgi:hypothetical protein
MQEEQPPESIRNELLERLKSLELPQESGGLTELASRRAREALERALYEAGAIRLQAIGDARATRERELSGLMDSLRALRQSAEVQVQAVTYRAELEAEGIRSQAAEAARGTIEQANAEAAQIRAEAHAMRVAAEERAGEVQRLEVEFDRLVEVFAQRVGVKEKPRRGWWRFLTGG